MQLFKEDPDSIRNRISEPSPPVPEAGPLWQPTVTAVRAPRPIAIPNEQALLDALVAPLDPADGHRIGNDKKEHRLARLFDELTSLEALTLHKRLADPKQADELAMAFEQRLAIERRKRLLAYLASPKRRAALGR